MGEMVKKTAFLFMVIALVAVSVVGIGCGAEKGTPAIDLVPQKANFAADVNLYRIFIDPDVLHLVNEIGAKLEEPKSVDELLDQVKQKTGIDIRDFSKIMIFGATEFERYVGAIVKGDFDQVALIYSIESAFGEKMTPTSYKGYQLYLITHEDEEVAICLLDENSIALGATVTVEDVIDVKEGATGLSGPVYEAYASLDDAWFKMAAEVPKEAMGDITFGDIPIPLKVFEDVRAAGFSFDKSGQALSAQFKLYFSTSESADAAGEAITSLMDLIKFLPNVSPEILDILQGLKVSVSGAWVTISLETTVAELRSLLQGIEDIEIGDTEEVDTEEGDTSQEGVAACQSEQQALRSAVFAYYGENGSFPTATGDAGATIDFTKLVPDWLAEEPASNADCLWMIDDDPLGEACTDQADCPCYFEVSHCTP